jgi:hypothetical protein
MSEIDYLAHEIEWVHAKERARLINANRPRRQLKTSAAEEFDPLAATCLAELIERRLAPKARHMTTTQPAEAVGRGGDG